MKRTTTTKKRRTTLSLPAGPLRRAAELARERNVNLSAVVGEALSSGMWQLTASERSEEVLRAYRTAFGGFSEEELQVLDGVMLDAAGRQAE